MEWFIFLLILILAKDSVTVLLIAAVLWVFLNRLHQFVEKYKHYDDDRKP
ncbi:hypothetical protein [Thalassotalea aquiviva]